MPRPSTTSFLVRRAAQTRSTPPTKPATPPSKYPTRSLMTRTRSRRGMA